MNDITANVQEPHFSNIKRGSKLVEGRLRKDKWAAAKAGDTLFITEPATGETIIKTIRMVMYADSFGELYDSFGEMLLPGVKTREEAEAVYFDFFGNQHVNYGVVGIFLANRC